MKKLVALFLVVALLFGFGFTVVSAALEPKTVVADPGIPTPDPPSKWPPFDCNSIGPITI